MIGLVYTIVLQHDQVEGQKEQIKQQDKELSRQAREQFLAARLNLQAAHAQLLVASLQLRTSEGRNQIFDSDKAVLSAAEVRLQILEHEIQQGFEGGAWTPAIQKEAIRRKLLLDSKRFVAAWDDGGKHNPPALTNPYVSELEATRRVTQIDYPEIAKFIDSMIAMFSTPRGNVESAVNWCRSAEIMLVNGQYPWI